MILFWTPQRQILIHFWVREDERPTSAWKEDHRERNNVQSAGILKCDCNHVDRRGIKTWRASLLAKATSSRRWASRSNTSLKHPHQISCEEFRYCQMHGTILSNLRYGCCRRILPGCQVRRMIAARNSHSFKQMGTESQVHRYCWKMVPCMVTSTDIAVQGRGVSKLVCGQGRH
jgi:hypothetical protein